MLRRFRLALVLLPLCLAGQEISIQPIVFGMYRSTGDWWSPEPDGVAFAGAGITGSMKATNLTIESTFLNSTILGLSSRPNDFTPEHGFAWDQVTTGKDDTFDSDFTIMKMTYDIGAIQFEAGKYDFSWGPSTHNINISRKAPSFPRFGFSWVVSPKFRFFYNHGQLNSAEVDTLLSNASPTFSNLRRLLRPRRLVSHRFEYDLPMNFTFAGTETVVYGDRGTDLVYLMPFISFWSAQHWLGDLDNTQLSIDLIWRHSPNFRVYGVFMMDEWSPSLTFEKENRNWFAYQTGGRFSNLISTDDELTVEATWVDHRVYRHRYPVNDYYSNRYPIGNWAGPHSQSFTATYMAVVGANRLLVRLVAAKRGELTGQMITDQYDTDFYERFSGENESLTSMRAAFYRPLFGKGWLELGLSYSQWKNAGFDPHAPLETSAGLVNKLSVNLGVYYNFQLPGYDVATILD